MYEMYNSYTAPGGHMSVPKPFNIGAELVDRNLRDGRGDDTAIWFNGTSMTYAELGVRVDRMAPALLRAGVEPEQRVLLIQPDSPDLAALYLAVMKIGAVAVPSNPLLRPGDYAYFLEESRARLLVTSAACLDRVEPALAGQRFLRRTVVVGLEG